MSEFVEFPTKGRATSGVRAHKFLKGETELSLAWVGDSPQAAAQAGGARTLPGEMSRRDGTGSPLESKIDVIGTLPRLREPGEDVTGGGGTGGGDVDGSGDSSAGSGRSGDSVRGDSGASGSGSPQAAGSGGLATSLDGLDLDADDAREAISRARIDTDNGVIVSHDEDDEDDGDDSALF